MSSGLRLVHADVLLLGDAPAIRDGALAIDGDGRIEDAGAAGEVLPRHAGAPIERIRGVIFPGLVNAHTHIELSSLRGKVSGGAGFVAWVEKFMGLRAGERPDEDDDAIDRAAAELVNAGVAAVGDISNTLATVRTLARHGIGGIVFHEMIGLDRTEALARVARARADLDTTLASFPSSDLAYAPAAHTLYTTHPDAVRAILQFTRERNVRSTIHLAEHAAERAFLESGSGPYADFARRKGFAVDGFPIPRQDPIRYARDMGALGPDVLAVHLTDAHTDELQVAADAGSTVVVCPRSNLFIETRLPPVSEMLALGIVPALGTDSLASNLSLDPFAEARALLDRFPTISTTTLFEMTTTAGARALDRKDLGRIARGTSPGIVAAEGNLEHESDPIRWLFKQPPSGRRWLARRARQP